MNATSRPLDGLGMARLIQGFLMAGLIVGMVVGFFIAPIGKPDAAFARMSLIAAAVMSVACAGVSIGVMPGVMAKVAAAPRNPGVVRAAPGSAYLMQCVMRAALIEGPALFGMVIFLNHREPLAVAIPTFALCVLALTFPNADREKAFLAMIEGRKAG